MPDQEIIDCPLHSLTLIGTPTLAPTLVGGTDALSTNDGDGSYLEWGGEPAAPSGAYYQGRFARAAIPAGNIVTGIYVSVLMRASGAGGDSTIYADFWDGGVYHSRQAADDAGWLWSGYNMFAENGTTYDYVDPVFNDLENYYPELGFELFGTAREWTSVQDADSDEYSWTLQNIRAGNLRCAIYVPGFFGTGPTGSGYYLTRITKFSLMIRHAPIEDMDALVNPPTPVYTPFESVPSLEGHEGVYGFNDHVLFNTNEDHTGVGGYPTGWVQSALDAAWQDTIVDTTPICVGSTGTANGIYNTFTYMRVSNGGDGVPPYVNIQGRNEVTKVIPYPNEICVRNNSNADDIYAHQRNTAGFNNPYSQYAGLVLTQDQYIDWASYRLTIEKYEIAIRGGLNVAFGPLALELRKYPDGEGAIPSGSAVQPYTSWTGAGVDERVGVSTPNFYYDHYVDLPGYSGAASATLPLLDSHTFIPGDDTYYGPYVDVTDDVIIDTHGFDCVFVWWAQQDQHSGSAFPFGPPGNEGLNGEGEQSSNDDVLYRLQLGFPDRRYTYASLFNIRGPSGVPLRMLQRNDDIGINEFGSATPRLLGEHGTATSEQRTWAPRLIKNNFLGWS